MNIRRLVLTIFILAGLSVAIAHADKLPQFGTHTRDQFQDYWYNHGAEISRFSLQQMRYGEIRIQKWHETYGGLIGTGAKVLTTRAVRTHTIMDPYWKHHTNKDRGRLQALGLSAREMGSN